MRSERSPEPIWSLRSAARALSSLVSLGVVELGAQHRHRLGAVLVLRALLLDHDHDAARHMGDADRRFGLVDVLAAGALRSHGVDLEVVGLISMSTSSTSGSTATVAAEVWMRPCASVSGTRWTRCTPDSNFSRANGPRPRDLGDDLLEAALGAFGERRGFRWSSPAARQIARTCDTGRPRTARPRRRRCRRGFRG